MGEYLPPCYALSGGGVVKEFVPAVAAIIAGIFAIVSPFITWKLKNASDERARLAALDKDQRDELKHLLTDIHVLFEQAISQVLRKEEFALGREFSEANAKIHLLAPEAIVAQYSKVAILLEEWSRLHYKATPRQWKVGEQTITVLQAPDPTEKYKEPEREAHQRLQRELDALIELMRIELGAGHSLGRLSNVAGTPGESRGRQEVN